MIEGASQGSRGPDNQLIGRPKCGTPNCNAEGWISFAGCFRCGVCVDRLVNARKEVELGKMAKQKADADKFLMETNAAKREVRI